MREWQLKPGDPMAPRIAADARAGRTDYHDDQVWGLHLGGPSEPALSLETRYGGRVGLARIVPVWGVGRRKVYETQAYHAPPLLTAFTPDLLCVRAGLTRTLALTAEFWTMESQAVGGRFTVRNDGDQPQPLRLDLTAQAARQDQALPMLFLTLEGGTVALQMGRLSHLQPVLLLEGARETGATAQLSRAQTVPPGEAPPPAVGIEAFFGSYQGRGSGSADSHATDRDLAVTIGPAADRGFVVSWSTAVRGEAGEAETAQVLADRPPHGREVPAEVGGAVGVRIRVRRCDQVVGLVGHVEPRRAEAEDRHDPSSSRTRVKLIIINIADELMVVNISN